jgi:hypothetical protein
LRKPGFRLDVRLAAVYREVEDAGAAPLELAMQAFFHRCKRGETPGVPRYKPASYRSRDTVLPMVDVAFSLNIDIIENANRCLEVDAMLVIRQVAFSEATRSRRNRPNSAVRAASKSSDSGYVNAVVVCSSIRDEGQRRISGDGWG